MSLAILQPYLFPYVGYFQLVSTVNTFVFYDDVNFITQGWIHRNKVLINGEAKYFTIPCRNASQHKLIKTVKHALTDKKRNKLLRKIKFSYSNAPFFDSVYPLFKHVINFDSEYIVDMAIRSIIETCNYLDLDANFKLSSLEYDNAELDRTQRIIDICKKEQTSAYINLPGGKEIYDKADFKEHGIDLKFLEPMLKEYNQFNNEFVPGLSIIDIMMFKSPKEIKSNLLNAFKLV